MRFSQEMMALYKREQVQSIVWLLAILLQMPIFLALYLVLMESVELRHAPWLGWIQIYPMDPWFYLAVDHGVTMYVQQMLNPQRKTDQCRQKSIPYHANHVYGIHVVLPAGPFVLYWIVNNSITILQQWFINKSVEKTVQQGWAERLSPNFYWINPLKMVILGGFFFVCI